MSLPHSLGWLNSGSYDVVFAKDLVTVHGQQRERLFGVPAAARKMLVDRLRGRRILLVTTSTVWTLHGGEPVASLASEAGADLDVLVEPFDEASKTMASVMCICERAQAHELGRRDLLVAFGGGVCCDLVGMAASLYRRGIDYVCLPTTLVGQIDAGIGIKQAVNFAGQKSRLGSFHPPVAVFSDPRWLATLSRDAIRSGLAEIVKVAVMRNARLFDWLSGPEPPLSTAPFSSLMGLRRRSWSSRRKGCWRNYSLIRSKGTATGAEWTSATPTLHGSRRRAVSA